MVQSHKGYLELGDHHSPNCPKSTNSVQSNRRTSTMSHASEHESHRRAREDDDDPGAHPSQRPRHNTNVPQGESLLPLLSARITASRVCFAPLAFASWASQSNPLHLSGRRVRQAICFFSRSLHVWRSGLYIRLWRLQVDQRLTQFASL